MSSDNQLVACVQKNQREEIRISLSRFKGVDLIDVRTFVNFGGTPDDERNATKKGISLKVERLPELLDALKAALETARAQGLLDADRDLAA